MVESHGETMLQALPEAGTIVDEVRREIFIRPGELSLIGVIPN